MLRHQVASVLLLVSIQAPVLAATSEEKPLAAPEGSALTASYDAKGVQIYTCEAKDQSFAWSSAVPEADLLTTDGRSVGHHSRGPTWETWDGARVVGSVLAKQPAPQPDAVPWLLLSTNTTGSGALAGTRYVVRRDTTGGLEPREMCDRAGLEVRVPYTATYEFYR